MWKAKLPYWHTHAYKLKSLGIEQIKEMVHLRHSYPKNTGKGKQKC